MTKKWRDHNPMLLCRMAIEIDIIGYYRFIDQPPIPGEHHFLANGCSSTHSYGNPHVALRSDYPRNTLYDSFVLRAVKSPRLGLRNHDKETSFGVPLLTPN